MVLSVFALIGGLIARIQNKGEFILTDAITRIFNFNSDCIIILYNRKHYGTAWVGMPDGIIYEISEWLLFDLYRELCRYVID